MVEVMQKSVLVPYEKYKRLISLLERHAKDEKASHENVATIPEKSTAPESNTGEEKKDESTQTTSDEQMKRKQPEMNRASEKSEGPHIDEEPVLKKRKQIENKNPKVKSRYRLQTKWIQL
jgi:hypothetical protein